LKQWHVFNGGRGPAIQGSVTKGYEGSVRKGIPTELTHKQIRDQGGDHYKLREEGAGTFLYPPPFHGARYKTVIVLSIDLSEHG
jgi:hypothetical protein